MFMSPGSRGNRVRNGWRKFASLKVGGLSSVDIAFPPGGTAIEILGFGRSGQSGTGTDAISARFNGDTGANYSQQTVHGNVSTASASQNTSQTSARFAEFLKAGDLANHGDAFRLILPFYDRPSVLYRSGLSFFETINNTAIGNMFVLCCSIRWNSAAPIQRLTILAASGPWLANTEFDAYFIP
jgi:hypothetical protein